jgi:hypothetical protein
MPSTQKSVLQPTFGFITGSKHSEKASCTPVPINPKQFNKAAKIPYGCTVAHIQSAMADFISFLGFINNQLATKKIQRLESFMMPANFSSLVGEFMNATIPKYCPKVAKNSYHNGHPDLLPKGVYPNDSKQHADKGIEIKGSRHVSGWQGHNVEDVWLMVFVFDSNTARDESLNISPRPFRFVKVVGALITKDDWAFSGRSATSRRTITASVTRSGFTKMEQNWIYRDVS